MLAIKIMNTKENIRLTLRQYRSQATIGLFGLLLGLLTNVVSEIPSGVLDVLPPRPILLALLASLLLILILVSWLFLLLREEKFTLQNGIYWDKKNNPFCPACKTPLTQIRKKYEKDVDLYCSKCANSLFIVDTDNKIKE